jgi:preprotein translocase subunit SecE
LWVRIPPGLPKMQRKNMNAIKDMTDADTHSVDAGPEPEAPIQTVSSTASLGLTRWVQYVFVVVALLLLWFLDKVGTLVWQNFAEPPTVAITALAAVISVSGTVAVYRNERAHDLVTDVVVELSKVTWPTRKETYSFTVVVIITSLIAAAVVGAFDFVWSYFTDLLYKHKV